MATSLVDDRRVHALNDHPPGTSGPVVYWMQAAVRTHRNDALEFAIRTANRLERPLLVCFGLDTDYRDATPRTLRFLAEGLVAAATGLRRRSIPFTVRAGHPLEVAEGLAADACAVVTDRAYLREPRSWRTRLAGDVDVTVWEIETNVVVPVEITSDKREYAARTIRPKIHRHLQDFLIDLSTTPLHDTSADPGQGLALESPEALMESIRLDAPPGRFEGGQYQARALLDRFVGQGLTDYRQGDLDVSSGGSGLSPYLHFGHLSPVTAVMAASDSTADQEAIDAFVEELVVRRELAHNFVWYASDYDSFRSLPDWARSTLEVHRSDPREEIYTKGELEGAQTHDRVWNAAMTEMRETGYLHNHLRMYWGKQILRWTRTPSYAHQVALELNNRHFFDGRDPNSYANIGWIFGLHDRAFGETEVFGKVRPMTRSGLDRKIDIDSYIRSVEEMTGQEIV